MKSRPLKYLAFSLTEMPLTNAEKHKRFIEKLKAQGKYEEFKKKHREVSKKSKEKQNAHILSLPSSLKKKKLAERNAANRNRVAKCRNLKKQKRAEAAVSKPKSPFRSAMAFAKATARAKKILEKALPSSPRKKRKVSQQLFKDASSSQSPKAVSKRTAANAISPELIKVVKKFFERDDISRQAPGMKDCRVFREKDGNKTKIQIRHLTASLKETFALFCEEFPEAGIGKSKFAELRPKHVYLSKQLPHNVCMCRYHENFISAIDSLHKVSPCVPSYSHDFPATLLCKSPNRKCWTNQCDECNDASGFKRNYTLDEVANDDITWHVRKKGEDGRLMKAVEEGTVEDLLAHICDMIPQFLEHCYIKREQAAAYNKERDEAQSEDYDPEIAVIQVDFSENYTCVWQDEIQSAHWNQSQVTLFTVATWHTGEIHSSCFVSDNLTHSKETLVAYIDRALEDLPSHVKIVSLWSDGPRSQFKNRFVAAAIKDLESKHDVKIKWSFFATSHGKGPVDGIGGAAKRFVWDAVRLRKHSVKSAGTFASAASKMPKVKVHEMTAADIEGRNKNLNLDVTFESAEQIKDIAQKHFIQVEDGKVIASLITADGYGHTQVEAEYTGSETASEEDVVNTADEHLNIGQWCVVKYDGEVYPGEVKEIGDQRDIRVSVMHRAGQNWKWPNPKDDCTFYLKQQIVCRIEEPIIANNRGHFKFTSHF